MCFTYYTICHIPCDGRGGEAMKPVTGRKYPSLLSDFNDHPSAIKNTNCDMCGPLLLPISSQMHKHFLRSPTFTKIGKENKN
jgi:hypothetical protein